MNQTLRTLALASVLSLFAGGCLPSNTKAPEPVSPKEPTVAEAAEHFSRLHMSANAAAEALYLADFAQAASDTAARAKANEFKDVTAADEFFAAATKRAREESESHLKAVSETANKELVAAMNKAFTDEKNKPGSSTATLFEELAKGFGRVVPKEKKGK